MRVPPLALSASESGHRLALCVSYDGTPFRGWTDIRDAVLRPNLAKILQHEVLIDAASRTDAGVHAAAQVCSLPIERALGRAEVSQLCYSLNQLLPPEVAVRKARCVDASFDVRSNVGKEYRYKLSTAAVRDPLSRLYAWHVPPRRGRPRWNAAAAADAALRLRGTHSFGAFGNTPRGPTRKVEVSPVCSVRELSLVRGAPDGSLEFRVVADRFLYKMARNLVGSLVLVGAGELSADDVAHALESGQFARGKSLPITAPAHGLVLQRVMYGEPGGGEEDLFAGGGEGESG